MSDSPVHDGRVGEVLAADVGAAVVPRPEVGEPPGADTLVLTGGHVRPVWQDGLMTLITMPAAGGRVAPAEVANPTPCCADH
ncbi:hypothetical protein [Nonomuraea sp. NPDC002799]